MHPDEFKADFIKRVIASCKFADQADACMCWVDYLVQREVIAGDTAMILREYSKDKKKDVPHIDAAHFKREYLKDLPQRPPKKDTILPHLIANAKRIEDEKRRKIIKIVRNVAAE